MAFRLQAPLLAAMLTVGLGHSVVVGQAVAAPKRADTACSRPPQKGVPLPETSTGRTLADRLGLAQAWDLADGTGVTVGVVDSGVDGRHPELAGAVGAGKELFGVRSAKEFGVQAPKAPHLDCQGHGTGVAGLIAASRSGEPKINGVAPGVRILPIRMVDGVDRATANTLAAGIDQAVRAGVRVLNLSFALPVDRPPVREAVRRALAADVVVVAAAGNEGTTGVPMYPAAYDGVLAVGAVDAAGEPMEQSNRGDWVDIAAYGEDEIVPAAGGSGYQQVSGTSFATPQVAGAAALIRSRFPGLKAANVADRLTASAISIGGSLDQRTGAGLVDPFAALTHLPADAGERAGPGAIPVQALPAGPSALSSRSVTALAWSGGLLLAVVLALTGVPVVRRASARGWQPGPDRIRSGAARGRPRPFRTAVVSPPTEALERLRTSPRRTGADSARQPRRSAGSR
ncbi:S8 family serine peptidase [Streptomyces sp. NPDC057644]|uniref:S8 family peptidase n=1 Tax=Streptomyces sp. NPDC057644 TaxID=3346191 RepID=UPI00367DF636